MVDAVLVGRSDLNLQSIVDLVESRSSCAVLYVHVLNEQIPVHDEQ